MGKEKATHSLPDHERERQRRVIDFWPCMMVDELARCLLIAIYGVLTSFIDYNS
jgi:hypothetical protein